MPFSVRVRCGHCRQVVDMPFVSTQEFAGRDPNPPAERQEFTGSWAFYQEIRNDDETDAYAVGPCPLCAKPNLLLYRTKRRFVESIRGILGTDGSLLGGASLVTIQAAYPAPPKPDAHESWPAKAAALFAEAQTMLEEGRSPAIIIGTCRSVLDVATRELGGTQPTLVKRIDELRGRGVITESLTDWAHELRVDGNTAVHEIEGDAETARDLVAFLRVFMQVAFTLPADIARKRARVAGT